MTEAQTWELLEAVTVPDGRRGTVVEVFDDGYLVEVCDDMGRCLEMVEVMREGRGESGVRSKVEAIGDKLLSASAVLVVGMLCLGFVFAIGVVTWGVIRAILRFT